MTHPLSHSLSNMPLSYCILQGECAVKTHVLAILLALAGLTSTASAGQIQWTWSSGNYVVEGALSTSETAGLIDETDVTTHEFTVYESGVSLFTVDLVLGKLNGVELEGDDDFIDHDFEYVIGNDRFELINSAVNDEKRPRNFQRDR